MKNKKLFAVLSILALATPAIAGTTSTGNLTLNGTVQNAISLQIENSTGTASVSTLSFGNMNAVGAGTMSGDTDAVRLHKTDNSLVAPSSAFGTGFTNGAFYVIGSNTSNPAIKVRVRITSGADADVRMKVNAGNTLNPYYAATNNDWSSTTGVNAITNTDVTIAGTSGTLSGSALGNDQSVDMDLAAKVTNSDTTGAKTATVVFTADSNAF